jgi:hypothetical protein
MTFRKTLFAVCLVVSVLCLASGYGIAGKWIGVVMAIITGLVWLLARKYPASWLPHICLFASVCLAVIGRLTGSPPLLMICGSGVALAVWDLLLLEAALGSDSSGEQTRRYENKHLQSLVLVLGAGLCVVFFGRLLTLQIPFVLLVLFVALAVFGLDRAWGYIKKRRIGR